MQATEGSRRNPTNHRFAPGFFVQLTGLVATWFIISLTLMPRLHRHSFADLAVHSLLDSALACLFGGVVMIALQFAIRRSAGFESLQAALRASRTVVWFLPAGVLLYELSPFSLTAALVLAVSATQLLFSGWTEPFPPRLLGLSFAVALIFQSAAVAGIAGYPRMSAMLVCLTAALLALAFLLGGISRVQQAFGLRGSLSRSGLVVLVAAGLTVASLYSGSQSPAASDPRAGPRKNLETWFQTIFHRAPRVGPNESVTGLFQPDTYPGVILWPEASRKRVVLRVPSPRWLKVPINNTTEIPASIPFDGQYWMFKAPETSPPRGSYFQKASPLNLSFSSNDRRPLSMEARQKLDHPIDIACCQAIQIAISNEDLYRGSVAIELILIDTRTPGAPGQSLGTREIESRPWARSLNLSVPPVAETLEFPLPRGARIRQFDEFRVVFHLARMRSIRSARISIERFVLVP